MFDILPAELKSLAVRTKVSYVSVLSSYAHDTLVCHQARANGQAPHPYVWMSKAHALPTGLGIENEGLELPLDQLPEWEKSKIKLYPVVS